MSARHASESDDERALREGLSVNPLSADAMARIRAAAHAEWQANVERPRRRFVPWATAAALLAVTFASALFYANTGTYGGGEPAARLVRFEAPGVSSVRVFQRDTSLTDGAVLRAGNTYRVQGQALLELEGGGNVRIAAGSEIEIEARDVIRLERGELYVDIAPGMHADSAFTARTTAGEFRHVGTQFSVAVSNEQTRLRVREGRVSWLAGNAESTVEAGTEVVIANDAKVIERRIAASGNEWDWTAKTPPDFAIDERPLGEFLEWVARQSGRKLIFLDERAKQEAAKIRMHGSVHGLTPLQALSAVMAATELRYELRDEDIRVSFAGDSPPRS